MTEDSPSTEQRSAAQGRVFIYSTTGPENKLEASTLELGHTLAALLSAAGVTIPRRQHKQTPITWTLQR